MNFPQLRGCIYNRHNFVKQKRAKYKNGPNVAGDPHQLLPKTICAQPILAPDDQKVKQNFFSFF